ncbi:general transcriptional corepressor CYC8 [Nematocida sp. AWRm77]|nr:general transcriptional corepressor CYC8 [Nematocida sp. AWRm77]
MDSDTKINLLQNNAWKDLPGMERVPILPKKMKTDIYTKLLLENEAGWVIIGRIFQEFNIENYIFYAYERALANNPMSKDALSNLGPLYKKKKNFARALDVFLRLYRLSNGEDMLCAANVAFCYLMTDSFTESLIWYKIAARHSPQIKEGKGFLWYGIGVLYERLNNLQTAEEAYASAIKVDLSFEQSMETYFRLGVTYKKRGAIQTAMDCFEYLIHNIPQNFSSPSKEDVIVQIAHVHELQKRDVEAIEMLREVCQVDTQHEKAALLLAWLLYKQNTPERAKEVLERIPEEKMCAFSWYLMGRSEQKMENHEGAYRCYDQALTKDPNNYVYLNTLGTLYFTLLQFEDAMEAFKRSSELNPQFPEAIYNLGVVYEQFEDALDSAMEVYEKACDTFPEDKLLMDRMDELAERRGISEEMEEYVPPTIPLRDITPNPTKTPYFLAHTLLGYKPTSFMFSQKDKKEIEKIVEDLQEESSIYQDAHSK